MKRQTIFFFFLLGLLFFVSNADAEPQCLDCHKLKQEGRVVHPAVAMGCSSCHLSPHEKEKPTLSLLSDLPDLCYNCHDKTTFTKKSQHPPIQAGMCTSCHNPHSSNNEKLLLSKPPELCFNCHDKGNFTKKNIHPALEMGCTSCHFPHQSDNERLLQTSPPELCFNCHDKSEFTHKNVHPPVEAGMCTSCHTPHASENVFQLLKPINSVCADCHPDIGKTPHVVSGFSTKGHPLMGKKDPAREGREFACSSCHNPHSSESIRLFRYKAGSPFEICTYCHKY